MKTCLFCGSGYFDNEKKCTFCHRSGVNGTLMGPKVDYRRRALICPSYKFQFTLLLIPALMLFFIGLLFHMSQNADIFMFTFLPEMKQSGGVAFICIFSSIVMLICSLVRRSIAKKAEKVYYDLLVVADDADEQYNISLKKYYKFENMVCSKAFVLLLLPIVLYPLIIAFIYYADHYAYMVILNKYYVILPDVNGCNAFKFFLYVFPSVGMIAHFVDFVISIVNRSRYLRSERDAIALNADIRLSDDIVVEDGEEENEETRVRADDSIPFSFEEVGDGYGTAEVDPLQNLKTIDEVMAQTATAPCTDMTLVSLCSRLSLCLAHRGLYLSDEMVFNLVSSMAAYRLVSVSIEPQYTKAVYGALAECFGFDEATVSYAEEWKQESDILFTVENEKKTESQYLNGLYMAQYKPAYVCAVNVSDADANALTSMMQEFSAYSKNPAQQRTLVLVTDYNKSTPKKATYRASQDSYARDILMQLPQNAWCFLTQEKGKQTYVGLDVLVEGRSVNVLLEGHKQRDLDELPAIEGMPISYQSFMTNVKQASQKNFLPEDQWKKFDKLEAFLDERVGFAFGNRLCRKLEIYTEVYLACGGEVNQAIDHVLEGLLSTVLSSVDNEKLRNVDGKMSLYEFMEKTFGTDTIPCCHRLLNSFGFTI